MEADKKATEPKPDIWGVFLNERGALMIDRADRRVTGFICISGPKGSRSEALEYASQYVATIDKGVGYAVPNKG